MWTWDSCVRNVGNSDFEEDEDSSSEMWKTHLYDSSCSVEESCKVLSLEESKSSFWAEEKDKLWLSLEKVQESVRNGVNINASINNQGEKPLHIACKHGCTEVVRYLVETTAWVDCQDKAGVTPLHVASSTEMVRLLVEDGADVNAEDHHHYTPLDFACKKGLLPVMQELVRYGAIINRGETNFYTPLQMALSNTKKVKFLLESEGTDVNFRNKFRETALHHACKLFEQFDNIKTLLDAGADVNCNDQDGNTPLHFACRNRSINIVEVLLRYGADTNCINKDMVTPLHHAIIESSPAIVELLLDSGADVNIRFENGMSSFGMACQGPGYECAKVFLRKDIKIAPDEAGCTGLHYACKYGFLPIIQFLLDKGDDINATCKHGRTPLSYAMSYSSMRHFESQECSQVLVKHMAKLRCAKFHVNKRNVQLVDSDKRLTEFHSSCENEINRLKKCILHNNISVCDILIKPVHALVIYLKNPTVVQNFQQCNVQKMYPIYGEIIEGNFQKGQKRLPLVEKAETCLNEILCYELPVLFTREVLNYLNDNDLQSLIASQGTQAYALNETFKHNKTPVINKVLQFLKLLRTKF